MLRFPLLGAVGCPALSRRARDGLAALRAQTPSALPWARSLRAPAPGHALYVADARAHRVELLGDTLLFLAQGADHGSERSLPRHAAALPYVTAGAMLGAQLRLVETP